MSLSRIIKNNNVKQMAHIVTLTPKSAPVLDDEHVQETPLVDPQAGINIIKEAKSQANRMMELAKANAVRLEEEKRQELAQLEEQWKQEAKQQAYEDSMKELEGHLQAILDLFCQDAQQVLLDVKEELTHQQAFLKKEASDLGIHIAQKILHQQITLQPEVLETLIVEEVEMVRKQKVSAIKINQDWMETLKHLKERLHQEGIEIEYGDRDEIFIESEHGLYDISIATQLANIKELFEGMKL